MTPPRHGDAALVTLRGCRDGGRVMPQAKSTEERKVIAAEARVLRQPLQFARIAAADDYIIGLERGAELRHDFIDDAAPFLDAQSLEAARADPLLVSAPLFVAQVRKFHGRNDAIDDHGGAESGSKA